MEKQSNEKSSPNDKDAVRASASDAALPVDDVVCKKCGLVNDYRIIEKPFFSKPVIEGEQAKFHKTAYCNGCDSYITHLSQNKPQMFYFGKYRNVPVDEVTDVNYLNWALGNIPKLSQKMKDAIGNRINQLTI